MSDPRLDTRIPERGFASADAAMDAFLAWVAELGLQLYPHQESAILEVFGGSHVVLDAPTGSGKSLVATALVFKTFAETGRAVYTAPIKALVSEKFFDLCRIFGPENVGMMTGDGAVNRDAPILVCTQEILANMALREGAAAPATAAVMDEFHYYADRDRGMAWQVPLLLLERTTFLLMSATLGDTAAIRADLEARTGRPVAEVTGALRPVPLDYVYATTPLHETLDHLVRDGMAPVYLVHFGQRAATEQAQALLSTDWCGRDRKRALGEAVAGFRFDSPMGAQVRRMVLHGVGVHHAGLLPRYRLLVEKLAQQGLLVIICGTDTLGVGINVPIRTVLFTQLCKYDGDKVRILRVRDFKQIAGRAGRAGFDDRGTVVAQAPEHVILNARIDARTKEGKKKAVKHQPPQRGYKHWDETTFRQLVERPPEPLESRFRVDHGVLLTLMQHAAETARDAGRGVAALADLVERCHATPAERAAFHARATDLLGDIERAGIVERDASGQRLLLAPYLQRDFSLHHSLSLFLVSALPALDRASPVYVGDVVALVEAILEDPTPVLLAQADKARGIRLAELKAAGVPYEERIELLQEVSWPRPDAPWLDPMFEAFASRHPWVGPDALRPKAVLGPMLAQFSSFTDVVKDLGIQRFEGVLLRYLTEGYKALVQNVPAEQRTDALLDAVAWLRALLARVDSSLVTEWERMLAGADAATGVPERPIDVSEDRRSFHARIRAELHALVRALAARDWEEAAAAVRQRPGEGWSPEAFAAAMAPCIEAHGGVVFDHRARLGTHTIVRPVGPHRWEVAQVLVLREVEDADDDDRVTWAVRGRVELRDDTNPDGPLVEVVGIGE